jgi:mannose/cellobiose epimerase-like protein (N-acyl-D-glucosamine 2-epimerase family)
MHLFEALLALSEVPGAEAVFGDATRLAEWVTGSLVRDDGALPELFDRDWRALPTDAGGWINVGHQFEWAFLLARAVERGMDDRLLRVALGLLSFGLAHGVDERDGGVYTRLPVQAPFEPPRRTAKGWWEQCEATRALLRFGLGLDHAEFLLPLSRNVAFFRAHLIDPEHGGWYSSADATDKSKGNEWKLDYHVVAMCMEGMRYSA